MRKLRLELGPNELTGSLPAEISNLSKLTKLEISANSLSDSLPESLNQLNELVQLRFFDNSITYLPDLSSITTLQSIYCPYNDLEFNSIEPNIVISNFVYSPQDNLGQQIDTTLTEDQDFQYYLKVGGEHNQYQWYKDGIILLSQTSETLNIGSLTLADAGSYHCEVTNTLVTGLTLYSRPIIITVTEESCVILDFDAGWNIFSLPYQPNEADVENILSPLMGNSTLVKVQDEVGNSLEDWGVYGGWQNNIGEFNLSEGYKIKLTSADYFELCGQKVSYPYPISLSAGWNIIGYPQTQAYDGKEVVQSLISSGKLIKAQDEAGNSIEDWGVYGGWQNNIGNFAPGEGYKVKVDADVTLEIEESYPNLNYS